MLPPAAPLPPPSLARPISPPGATGVTITNPVPQVEEKREEEEAFEASQAYAAALPPGEQRQIGGGLAILLVVAGAGMSATAVRGRRRSSARRAPAYAGRPRDRSLPASARSRRTTHPRRLP